MDIIAIVVKEGSDHFTREEGHILVEVTGWSRVTDLATMTVKNVPTDEAEILEKKFQSAMREKFEYR